MTDKPAVGKNLYKQALVRGRNGSRNARNALRRLIDERPGPQTTAMLIATAALALGEVDAALNELDEIGRNSKTLTKE